MAEVAARHLARRDASVQFLGADMSTKLKLMGVDVASIGDAHGGDARRAQLRLHRRGGVYKKLVVSGDRKQLLGAILVGDASDYGTLLQMVLNPLPLPEHPEELILPARAGAAKGLGVDLLPDAALICSCNSVTKGAHLRGHRRRLHEPRARSRRRPRRRRAAAAAARSPSRSSTPS